MAVYSIDIDTDNKIIILHEPMSLDEVFDFLQVVDGGENLGEYVIHTSSVELSEISGHQAAQEYPDNYNATM